jgi:hypothetical protein
MVTAMALIKMASEYIPKPEGPTTLAMITPVKKVNKLTPT